MVILALETATRAGSVAIVDGTHQYARASTSSHTHSERLPEELFDFLAENGKQLEDVDYLAVVTGPGSFTGLRIGLASIQGIAIVAMKAVIPIPTLDAMASAWTVSNQARSARLVTCLDGARGDVFFAVFDVTSAGTAEAIVPPAVGSPLDAAERVTARDPETSLIVIGDGAARYRDVWARHPAAAIDDRPLNLALGAARLALTRRAQAGPPHALRPLYVRRPDAVLARERLQASLEAPPLTIRRVTSPEDLAAVAELQRRSFTNAWGAEAMRWELDHSDVARFYVATTAAGALVGYCACWFVADELHINSLAVDTASRRRGVARRMLDAVLRDAVAGGARHATLEVRQSNEAARILYEGLGFRVEGVRRNYYQNPREDALILWHRDLAGRFAPVG